MILSTSLKITFPAQKQFTIALVPMNCRIQLNRQHATDNVGKTVVYIFMVCTVGVCVCVRVCVCLSWILVRPGGACTLIARFMGPTWGPSGADRTQVVPCWPHELCYLGIHRLAVSSFVDVVTCDLVGAKSLPKQMLIRLLIESLRKRQLHLNSHKIFFCWKLIWRYRLLSPDHCLQYAIR